MLRHYSGSGRGRGRRQLVPAPEEEQVPIEEETEQRAEGQEAPAPAELTAAAAAESEDLSSQWRTAARSCARVMSVRCSSARFSAIEGVRVARQESRKRRGRAAQRSHRLGMCSNFRDLSGSETTG